MLRSSSISIPLIWLAALVGGPAFAASGPDAFRAIPGDREFSGRLIARTRSADGPRPALPPGVTVRGRIAAANLTLLAVAGADGSGTQERQAAEAMLASGAWAYVQPDWRVFALGTPNDPRYAEQWHHTMMQSAAAWNLHTGASSIAVGIVDTGVAVHADLPNRLSGYNSVLDLSEADGADVTDAHGHGTHCAGCAAAAGNNAVGVSGMGWNLQVIPVRASDSGSAYESDLLEGALWAAEHGAVSVSVSFSGIGTQAHQDVGKAIHDMNASLLWAAGNSATNHVRWDLPDVLVVGASDGNDQRASFSSFGRGVDLFAPGVAILSTTRDGGYQAWSGTSMATPVANGALAMIRSINPQLTARQAEHVLLFSCDPWSGERDSEWYGFGRVNLLRAMQMAPTAHLLGTPTAHPEKIVGLVGMDLDIDVLGNDDNPDAGPLEIASTAGTTTGGESLEIVRGAGPEGRDIVRLHGRPDSAEGFRTFTCTARDPRTGLSSTATTTVELLAPMPAVATGPVTQGLDVRFYAVSGLSQLPDFSTLTPYASSATPRIDISAGSGAFMDSGRSDDVAAVFEGFLQATTDGVRTFGLRADDGARLWIDGTLVIDNGGSHAATTVFGRVAMLEGPHAIRVEYHERTGSAEVRLVDESGAWVTADLFRRPCPTGGCATAVSWGDDSVRQCGLLGAFAQADARWMHTAAVDASGTVRCVGDNSYGQCTVPSGVGPVASVACGDLHTLALRTDGTVWGWGYNKYGQCTPPAGLEEVVEVQAGWYHSIARTADGGVRAWGWGGYGQCDVPSWLSAAVQVDASDLASIALHADGTVTVWGGFPDSEQAIPGDLPPVRQVSAGFGHMLALTRDGVVRGWGSDDSGQVDVPADLPRVVQVAAGGAHSLALLADGSVRAWGDGNDGQTRVPADIGSARSVIGGGYHSVALRGLPEGACEGDIDGSGEVDAADIGSLLMRFGTYDAASDIDGSGEVDAADIGSLLMLFGPCP